MSAVIPDSPFLRRFDALWLRIRRVRLGQTVAWAGLLAVCGLALLVAADYAWELPRSVRLAGLGVVGVGLLVSLFAGWFRFRKLGTRPRTAAEIEQAFPRLGQAVRTVVQFGQATVDDVRRAGIREALVVALESDTHQRSRPMYLDSVVPTKPLWFAVGLAMAAVAALGLGSLASWEWRTALQRAFLVEVPYVTLAVTPGDVKVDLGAPVALELQVSGRFDRELRLQTRAADDPTAEWADRTFDPGEGRRAGPRSLAFSAAIEGVKRPLEYRGVFGALIGPTHRIDVRYPLELAGVAIQLTPPEYTNHPPAETRDPSFTAVEGTAAKFTLTFDQPPSAVSLLITDLSTRAADEPPATPETLPLVIEGLTATGAYHLTHDLKYTIVAETPEGQRLRENTHRIRVRADQEPEVYFEAPVDPAEVHSLAEMLMRIRVRDDFGMSRAGIVFEVNNEEEYPLLTHEFPVTREQLTAAGMSSPETQAALEKALPLEFFELEQTDSVAYYAYVEDNHPGQPHRAVTDLRFIDIRPFRTRFSVRDDMPGDGNNQGPDVATLNELISRQRFNLNRAMNLSRAAERNETIELNRIDAVVTSETEIALATRELADFLSGLMIDALVDEIQLLLQAEAHMLAAADSLSAAKYETAVLQMRDALKELILGRDQLRQEIQKNPRRFRALQAADRRMAQKLRRPKTDKQEAEEVVRRLRQLATEQQQIPRQMALLTGGGTPPEEPDPNALPAENPAPMPSDATSTNPPAGSGDPTATPSTPPAEPTDTPGPAGEPTEPPMPTEGADQPPSMPPKDGSQGTPSEPSATDEGGEETTARMTREELLNRQIDNTLEAREIETALGKLKNITDLATKRMEGARMAVEAAAAAMERGDSAELASRSEQATAELRELAQQVDALVKEEAAERINAAQQLARQLAEQQQALAMAAGQAAQPSDMPQEGMGRAQPQGQGQATEPMPDAETNRAEGRSGDADQTAERPQGSGTQPTDEATTPQDGAGNSTAPKPTEQRPGDGAGEADEPREADQPGGGDPTEALAEQAERNAATAKTIVDVLNSILSSTDPADRETIARVETLMREQGIGETVGRMEALPEELREGKFGGAQATAADSAERWEATANRLATTFRELSAPRMEELLEIDRRLAELRDLLQQAESERELVKWQVRVGELVQDLKELKVGGAARDELEQMLRDAGWSEDVEDFRLNAAGAYVDSDGVPATGIVIDLTERTTALSREIQTYIQELIMADLPLDGADAIPPEFQKLVERYYEVLAKERRPRGR